MHGPIIYKHNITTTLPLVQSFSLSLILIYTLACLMRASVRKWMKLQVASNGESEVGFLCAKNKCVRSRCARFFTRQSCVYLHISFFQHCLSKTKLSILDVRTPSSNFFSVRLLPLSIRQKYTHTHWITGTADETTWHFISLHSKHWSTWIGSFTQQSLPLIAVVCH